MYECFRTRFRSSSPLMTIDYISLVYMSNTTLSCSCDSYYLSHFRHAARSYPRHACLLYVVVLMQVLDGLGSAPVLAAPTHLDHANPYIIGMHCFLIPQDAIWERVSHGAKSLMRTLIMSYSIFIQLGTQIASLFRQPRDRHLLVATATT